AAEAKEAQAGATIELPAVTVSSEEKPNLSPGGSQTASVIGNQADMENPSGPLGGQAKGETSTPAEAAESRTTEGKVAETAAKATESTPGEPEGPPTEKAATSTTLEAGPGAQVRELMAPEPADEKSAFGIFSTEAEARSRGARGG